MACPIIFFTIFVLFISYLVPKVISLSSTYLEMFNDQKQSVSIPGNANSDRLNGGWGCSQLQLCNRRILHCPYFKWSGEVNQKLESPLIAFNGGHQCSKTPPPSAIRSPKCNLYKKWAIPGLFFFTFSSEYTIDSTQMFHINSCRWPDSNRGPWVSEATALPIEPHNHSTKMQSFNCNRK